MIIKIDKIVSCSSEHPSYPASNLLQYRSNVSWRCAKPGELLTSVILQLEKPTYITALDVGNYRSCIVIVTGSTLSEPDNWIPIVNHQFMTHDEAANGRFKDQVQLFTKRELSEETLKIKFDRIKVTCMQSANMRELFGLAFIILRTEEKLELGSDVLGRFKLKNNTEVKDAKTKVDEFKEKYLKHMGSKQQNYKDELKDKIKEKGVSAFNERQSELREPTKRPLLEKLEAGKANEILPKQNKASDENVSSNFYNDVSNIAEASSKPVARTPFGDVVDIPKNKTTVLNSRNGNTRHSLDSRKRSLSPDSSLQDERVSRKRPRCSLCLGDIDNQICKVCNQLLPQKPVVPRAEKPAKKARTPVKPKKEFGKLFEGVTFSLSGYKNPERDEIRSKALRMGAKYVADTNTRNHGCTHLVCAFKNTPKYQQLKGHAKIVTHKWVERCYESKTRFPWRRFALDKKDKDESESEEEIEGSTSPARPPNPYDQETDSDY